MEKLSSYKGYKLFEVTEKDVAESGGYAESRYIKNSVLVFLPDEENPKLGYEQCKANTLEEAEKVIDGFEHDNLSIKNRMEAAKEQSNNQDRRKRSQEKKELKGYLG